MPSAPQWTRRQLEELWLPSRIQEEVEFTERFLCPCAVLEEKGNARTLIFGMEHSLTSAHVEEEAVQGIFICLGLVLSCSHPYLPDWEQRWFEVQHRVLHSNVIAKAAPLGQEFS